LRLLSDLSFNEGDLPQAIKYADELIRLAEKLKNDTALFNGYFIKGTKETDLNSVNDALYCYITSTKVAEKLHNLTKEAVAYSAMGDVYSTAKNHIEAMLYYNKAIAVLRKQKAANTLISVLLNAGDELRADGDEHTDEKKYDSALVYFREARSIVDTITSIVDSNSYQAQKIYSLGDIGMLYDRKGQVDSAEKDLNLALNMLRGTGDQGATSDYLLSLSDVYSKKRNDKLALTTALQSLDTARQNNLKEQIANADLQLSKFYIKSGDTGHAYMYYKNYIVYRDSTFNVPTEQRLSEQRANFEVSKKQEELELVSQKRKNERKLLIYLVVIFGLTVVILFILMKNNRNRKKAYRILNKQKQEIEKQKEKTDAALKDLQSTQKKLIQSEKMASLGQLTAGIAHEIQNPLNFINNFSDVNKEIVDELRTERSKAPLDRDEKFVEELLNNLKDNEEKINHHGRRADAIVKGMLQHSRSSTGEKELTDINALAAEFLKLSYHGLRAKDKNFNATIVTSFNNTIDKINIVSQEIGRVFINLYNNAFYAVAEKKNFNIEGYEPTVWVTTTQLDGYIEIKVKDNGTGIPEEKIDKIFQPFFTTKPSGSGTGLGLSLSYDIIKAHDGEIKVESIEGEFAEFIIDLPAK
jgi:two-component system NtrC family sensor kinase